MARNNTVELVGHIGRDAQINGTVARTSIAVRNAWKDTDGSWQERTHWFPLVGFGEHSPVRDLAKGAHITLSGRLQSSQFTDRDGVQRTSVEVVVLTVEAIAKREAEPAAATPAEEPTPEPIAQPKPRRRRKAAPPVSIDADAPAF